MTQPQPFKENNQMEKFNAVINIILNELKKLGGDAAELAAAISEFIGTVGPKALPVVTEALQGVANKSVTPAQAIQDFQDVAALGVAATAAIATIKADQTTSATVVEPAPLQQ
jgi:hypothetical protein